MMARISIARETEVDYVLLWPPCWTLNIYTALPTSQMLRAGLGLGFDSVGAPYPPDLGVRIRI